MQKNYFLKAVFTLLLCNFFSLGYAADIYLSSTGNDANDGLTAQTALASFSQAQTLAASGDVIHVSGMIDFSIDPANTASPKTGILLAKSLTIQGSSNATDGFDGKSLTRFINQSTSGTYTLTLKDLKLVNGSINSAANGGALQINGATVNCENVIFDSNKAESTGQTGGAFQVDNANGMTFKNCVFSNNSASKTGAFYITAWAANSTIKFEGCAFLSNTAKDSFGGSALFIRANTSANTTLNLINCTIRGNRVMTAANGGAVDFGGKAPATTNVNIINCTITENTTAGTALNGAGVYFLNTNSGACFGSLYISNSIIENNTAAGGAYSDLGVGAISPTSYSASQTIGYIRIQNSIIGAVPTAVANVPAATNIVASPYYNYLTATSTTNDLKANLAPFNASNNTYPLYAGSNAIGYGSSALLTPYSTTDQLGNVRTVGATNYAGSVEAAPLAATTPDAPTALVATAGDGQISVAFKSAATGGTAVTNYKYSTDNGTTYTTCAPAQTTSPIVITGLSNNVAYTVKLKAVNAVGDGAESAASNSVTPTGTTGLENVINKITIFINPNNQIVVNNASQKTGTITVCNATGQRVASSKLNASTTTINKSFISGVYLVILNIEGKTRSTKIIL